jgi:hypothetical protein
LRSGRKPCPDNFRRPAWAVSPWLYSVVNTMQAKLTQSDIDAARTHLGLISDKNLQAMSTRLQKASGKGSCFAQRDNSAKLAAIQQELSNRSKQNGTSI